MQVYNLHMKNIFSEITEIFRYIDFETLNKIPRDIKQKIYNNANPKHDFRYDVNKAIKEQDIMEDTKDLIAIIFLRFCCNEEEKAMLLNECVENEKKFLEIQRNQYNNLDNIFNKEKPKDICIENQLVEYKESIFMKVKKIIFKILNFKS